MEIQGKNEIVLGNGRVSVGIIEDNSKNLIVSLSEINTTKIGSVVDKIKEGDEVSLIIIKNSKSCKVLLDAVKYIYKELKNREKELVI